MGGAQQRSTNAKLSRGTPWAGLWPWLVLAAGAHVLLVSALLVSALGVSQHRTSRNAPTSVQGATDILIEVETLPLPSDPLPTVLARGAPGAASEPKRVALAAPKRAMREPAVVHDDRESNDEPGDQLQSEATSDPTASSTAEPARRLSLGDLGIELGRDGLSPVPPPQPSPGKILNDRLQNGLRGELAASDQQLGLGPEGPAVSALQAIVLDSTVAPDSSGLLLVRTDSAGVTTHVEVRQASSHLQEWQRIADELKRVLAGKRLRIARGTAGVTMQLRVVSRVQRPSGAVPGSINIARFDLSDIGAIARRIVNVHLVTLETHARDTD
jgi:hypothetical protein